MFWPVEVSRFITLQSEKTSLSLKTLFAVRMGAIAIPSATTSREIKVKHRPLLFFFYASSLMDILVMSFYFDYNLSNIKS